MSSTTQNPENLYQPTAKNSPTRLRWRRRAGRWYYTLKRWLYWHLHAAQYSRNRQEALENVIARHQTPLLRRLKDVDMYLQHNKVVNLRLAAACINGIVLAPGQSFSFWFLVGRPSRRRGFLEGLVLEQGRIGKGTGGGLCQMGNLIHWMALHSPLTVTERWRHSYDVFPDENRKLPFGSGATLAYNYIDLQLRNDTAQTFQILLQVSETDLLGEIRSDQPVPFRYQIEETEHLIRHEPWGGYSRHNKLLRTVFEEKTDTLLRQEIITENHALMMYQPFLGNRQQE